MLVRGRRGLLRRDGRAGPSVGLDHAVGSLGRAFSGQFAAVNLALGQGRATPVELREPEGNQSQRGSHRFCCWPHPASGRSIVVQDLCDVGTCPASCIDPRFDKQVADRSDMTSTLSGRFVEANDGTKCWDTFDQLCCCTLERQRTSLDRC